MKKLNKSSLSDELKGKTISHIYNEDGNDVMVFTDGVEVIAVSEMNSGWLEYKEGLWKNYRFITDR